MNFYVQIRPFDAKNNDLMNIKIFKIHLKFIHHKVQILEFDIKIINHNVRLYDVKTFNLTSKSFIMTSNYHNLTSRQT